MTSKIEFLLNSLPIEKLQIALPVSPGSNAGEIQLGAWLRIARNTPFSPNTPPVYGLDATGCSGSQPLITGLTGINYGNPEEVLLPALNKYPMLSTLLNFLQRGGCEIATVAELAKQIAPALNATCKWDDPVVRSSSNIWREAKIEYEEYPQAVRAGCGAVLPVLDVDGCIRHLILSAWLEGHRFCVPLTFCQNPNYRSPMVCHFAFSPNWYLRGSELLKVNPAAEVWITNDIGLLDSAPTIPLWRIFLSYCFGKEQIPHLELTCLLGRNVKILIIRQSDREEMRRNFEEGVMLFSRLKELGIKTEFKIAEKAIPGNLVENGGIKLPDVISQVTPTAVSVEQIVKEAMGYGITIPENLRIDRYGALDCQSSTPLVRDFLNAGEVTGVAVHHGVDLIVVAGMIVAGLQKGKFGEGKWACCVKIHPVIFIDGSTKSRHNAVFKKLAIDNFSSYEMLSGSKEEVEHRLSKIVEENGFNVLLFESRQVVHDHRKELQIACKWGAKHGVGIVVITTQDDPSAVDFFSDIAGRDIHFWSTQKRRFEYIVEDRPLLMGEASAFKVAIDGQNMTVLEHAEEELKNILDRNVTVMHAPEEQDAYDSKNSTLNYRR